MEAKPKLLIVDDELSNLQKLQRTFITDFQIRQALSGAEALRLLEEDPRVDVIITDQKMAGISGVDLLSTSLQWCPDARRIILTGYTEVDYLIDAINEGQVHRYITKPWDPYTLKQTVLQDLEHHQLKAQNSLLEEQVRIAKQVQKHLLPRALPDFPPLEFSGVCKPAWQVGGDFFDFIRLSDREFSFAVGDISGKGISAALLMASLQALLRSQVIQRGQQVGSLLSDVNRLLCDMTDDSRFSTCFFAVFDSDTGSLIYANAGHNPPFLIKASGKDQDVLTPLDANGFPLGISRKMVLDALTIPFEIGDILAVYTDGIVEARNQQDEEFGEARLKELLTANRHLSPRELQDRILDDVEGFVDGGKQSDDLTLVMVRRES